MANRLIAIDNGLQMLRIDIDGGVDIRDLDALECEGYQKVRIVCYGGIDNLDFLLPYKTKIRSLELSGALTDTQSLMKLDYIEELAVYDKSGTLDFKEFPKLHKLRVDWHKRYSTDFLSKSQLKSLSIVAWPYKDITKISSASMLEFLTIEGGGLVSLEGVQCLPKLKSLDLVFNRKLEDIDAIPQSASLEVLTIDGAKKIAAVPDFSGNSSIREIKLHGIDVKDGSYFNFLSGFNLRRFSLRESAKGLRFPCVEFFTEERKLGYFDTDCVVNDVNWDVLFSTKELKDFSFCFIANKELDMQALINKLSSKYQRVVDAQGFMVKQKGTSFLSVRFLN